MDLDKWNDQIQNITSTRISSHPTRPHEELAGGSTSAEDDEVVRTADRVEPMKAEGHGVLDGGNWFNGFDVTA